MKNFILKGTMILSFILMTSFTVTESVSVADNLLGTWTYEAPDAPYEYSEGELVFSKKDGKMVGDVVIDGYKIEMENLVTKKDKVTFEVYVEGETVTIDLLVKKKSFTGTASYSEGDLEFNGKKIK